MSEIVEIPSRIALIFLERLPKVLLFLHLTVLDSFKRNWCTVFVRGQNLVTFCHDSRMTDWFCFNLSVNVAWSENALLFHFLVTHRGGDEIFLGCTNQLRR